MTDNQIINSLVKFALEIHHPYPIPVGDLLLQKYHCDHRQKDILLNQIEHYNLMKLIDEESGSEMRFTKDGLMAANSDNPIAYMEKLEADKNKPIIKGKNIIVGDNNSGNNQGRDFLVIPQSQPVTNPNQNATPIDMTEVKISKAQFIFFGCLQPSQ